MNNIKNKSIILFDGVCNLCNSSVNFIIKNDEKAYFLFASLQSDVAKEILLHHNSNKINFDTIILVENNKIFYKSTAALRIIKRLDGPIKILYFLIIVPPFIRDSVYNFIAKNRYKWYGKKESCVIPTDNYKKRFLDLI
ncbi:thiol-disulfide oxidoreductase DCC family protein [Lutibacter citreus]|uniref:thiol-disulfide oxidoreductase DCC family protein n=1 Tax=Lutibacter citreus TaxID=2138210 RepID=UPI000DBE5831|nr:thiol-disulfide oxidoreductase DCC family protein [Lutibacter citreus]